MPQLAIHTLDGKTPIRFLRASETTAQLATSWARNGRIAMTLVGPGSSGDIGIEDEGGTGPLTQAVKTRFKEVSASLSPDGEFLAYASDESGKWEVYVQPVGSAGEKIQVSIDGGEEPVWGRNGKEIFFRFADFLMAAPVNSLHPLDVGTPQRLIRGSFAKEPITVVPSYDVTSDGRRFLMVEGRPASANARTLTVILNRFEQ